MAGELDGVADQVGEHLAQPAGVADQAQRQVGGEAADQLQALGLGARREQLDDVAHRQLDVEGDRLEGQLAGLDLGEVEDVVDHRQQGVAGMLDGGGVIALFGIELGIQQQFRHAHHAVHRGADLMRHVGEELALRAVGLLGALLGLGQGAGALVDLLLQGGVEMAQVVVARAHRLAHGGEGERQPADLIHVVVAARRHREIAARQPPARLDQGAEPAHPARDRDRYHHHADRQRQRQRRQGDQQLLVARELGRGRGQRDHHLAEALLGAARSRARGGGIVEGVEGAVGALGDHVGAPDHRLEAVMPGTLVGAPRRLVGGGGRQLPALLVVDRDEYHVVVVVEAAGEARELVAVEHRERQLAGRAQAGGHGLGLVALGAIDQAVDLHGRGGGEGAERGDDHPQGHDHGLGAQAERGAGQSHLSAPPGRSGRRGRPGRPAGRGRACGRPPG